MKLQRHMTKMFFTDLDTGREFCVSFIDFEHRSDGFSVLVQEATKPGKCNTGWKNLDMVDTDKHPSDNLAQVFINLAIKGHEKKETNHWQIKTA